MGIYDVPAAMLIEELAKDFKAKVKKPSFTEFAKTGAHKERAPNNPDWFYTRMGSVLYRTYKDGITGTGKLRTYYGGRKNRGVRPEKKMKASGKVIRTCLQLLEKEGLLTKEKKGRKVSAKGEKLLFAKAKNCQIAFNDMLKKEEQHAQMETEKRAANRAKALAPKPEEPKKDTGIKRDQRPMPPKRQEQGAQKPQIQPQKGLAPDAEQQKGQKDAEQKPKEHKVSGDGRAGPEAK